MDEPCIPEQRLVEQLNSISRLIKWTFAEAPKGPSVISNRIDLAYWAIAEAVNILTGVKNPLAKNQLKRRMEAVGVEQTTEGRIKLAKETAKYYCQHGHFWWPDDEEGIGD